MTSPLIKTLPLAVVLLATASGCELINFNEAIEPPSTGDDPGIEGGAPPGPQPLYPFRPGSKWQYNVTELDGTMRTKLVAIDAKPVMTQGTGPHQLDMAYAVRTTISGTGLASVITMQQAVGDQIVNWREDRYDQQGLLTVDVSWDPQQIELDQSDERTKPGTSWIESYTQVNLPQGGLPSTVKQNETWTVAGKETLALALPNGMMSFDTIVFQKATATGGGGGGGDGGGGDGGMGAGDAGKSDAGVSHPSLVPGQTWSQAADSGVAMPKTMWYARGYGKLKEAGGGEATEELTGLEFH